MKSSTHRVPPLGHAETETISEPETVPDAWEGTVTGLPGNPAHSAWNLTPLNEPPATGSRLTAVKLMVQLPDAEVLETLLNPGVAQLSATSA